MTTHLFKSIEGSSLTMGSTTEITGWWTCFGNVDQVGDRAVFGSMTRTLKEHRDAGTRWALTAQHEWNLDSKSVVGFVDPWELEERSEGGPTGKGGIYGTGHLFTADSPTAAYIAKLAGPTGLGSVAASYAYDTIRERKAADHANELLDVTVLEWTCCLFGANQLAILQTKTAKMSPTERKALAQEILAPSIDMEWADAELKFMAVEAGIDLPPTYADLKADQEQSRCGECGKFTGRAAVLAPGAQPARLCEACGTYEIEVPEHLQLASEKVLARWGSEQLRMVKDYRAAETARRIEALKDEFHALDDEVATEKFMLIEDFKALDAAVTSETGAGASEDEDGSVPPDYEGPEDCGDSCCSEPDGCGDCVKCSVEAKAADDNRQNELFDLSDRTHALIAVGIVFGAEDSRDGTPLSTWHYRGGEVGADLNDSERAHVVARVRAAASRYGIDVASGK